MHGGPLAGEGLDGTGLEVPTDPGNHRVVSYKIVTGCEISTSLQNIIEGMPRDIANLGQKKQVGRVESRQVGRNDVGTFQLARV